MEAVCGKYLNIFFNIHYENIHIHICSQTEITNNILKEMRIVSFHIQPYKHNGKLRKGFDILSTIFKLVGSSNLRFDFFQIFGYIREYIRICPSEK